MKYFIVITLFLISTLSCVRDMRPSNVVTPVTFFDTAEYLDSLFHDSNARMLSIQKKIVYNSEEEIIHKDHYDITQDLDVLKKMNVNNPSWIDKYVVDTISVQKNIIEIRYQAAEPSMEIKSLTCRIKDGVIIGFEGEMERDALIAHTSKTVSFSKDQGYQITTKSKRFGIDEILVQIQVTFNPS